MKSAQLTFALFLFLGSVVQAKEPLNGPQRSGKNRVWVSPLILSQQFERTNEQIQEWRQIQTFAASYQQGSLEFLVEYEQHKVGSGNETSSIETETKGINFWLHFLEFRTSTAIPWRIYMGIGAGGFEESVTTNFMDESRTDRGGLKNQVGTKLGSELQIPFFESKLELIVRAESRIFYGGKIQAELRPSLQGSLGLAYKF